MAGQILTWHCVCVALCIVTAVATLSGLYIDNGVDQTVIHHLLTRNERLLVEHEILELLGLSKRPRRVRAPSLDRSAPIFLLNVYKQLEDIRDQARPTRSSKNAISGEERQAIDESDLIMTFQSKKHHLGALRHGHGRHVWFDLAGAPTDPLALVTAELRLYQASTQTEQPTAAYTILVHRMLRVDNVGELQLEQVAAVNTSAGSEGWLEFNVTGALAALLTAPSDNKGFFITLHPHSQPEEENVIEESNEDENSSSEVSDNDEEN